MHVYVYVRMLLLRQTGQLHFYKVSCLRPVSTGIPHLALLIGTRETER